MRREEHLKEGTGLGPFVLLVISRKAHRKISLFASH